MKVSSKAYWLIGAALGGYFCLTYFKRPSQSDSGKNKVSAQKAVESNAKVGPAQPIKLPKALEPESSQQPDGFSGTNLLPQLGAVLSNAMLEELQKAGDFPEMQAAALEPGGKTYGLGIHAGGGLIVNLGKDNALLAFGIASNKAEATSDEERRLLAEFKHSGQSTVPALDEKFEAVEMQIHTYESKVAPKNQALMYSIGGSRTLVFFDSTRVAMKKLLPASPETIDPAMLKQLRSMLGNKK